MAAIVLLHERVELPEPPAILVEESVHERLVELVVTARATVPPNPLIGATVMAEVPATLTLVETLLGVEATLKSWAWYVTVAE